MACYGCILKDLLLTNGVQKVLYSYDGMIKLVDLIVHLNLNLHQSYLIQKMKNTTKLR